MSAPTKPLTGADLIVAQVRADRLPAQVAALVAEVRRLRAQLDAISPTLASLDLTPEEMRWIVEWGVGVWKRKGSPRADSWGVKREV